MAMTEVQSATIRPASPWEMTRGTDAAKATARQNIAVAEQAIVGQHGADAGEDGVAIVTDFLHVGAGALAGDPAAIVVGCGDFAVQGDGGLEGDQGARGAHEVQEGFVELLGFGGELGGDLDLDAGRAEPGKALSGDPRHAGLDQGVDAGRSAAVVGAGFQVEIEGSAARLVAGLGEGDDFSVVEAGVGVEAAADDLAFAHQDCPDERIGTGQRAALARQVERFAHVWRGHFSNNDSMNFSESKGSRSSTFSPTPM